MKGACTETCLMIPWVLVCWLVELSAALLEYKIHVLFSSPRLRSYLLCIIAFAPFIQVSSSELLLVLFISCSLRVLAGNQSICSSPEIPSVFRCILPEALSKLRSKYQITHLTTSVAKRSYRCFASWATMYLC